MMPGIKDMYQSQNIDFKIVKCNENIKSILNTFIMDSSIFIS